MFINKESTREQKIKNKLKQNKANCLSTVKICHDFNKGQKIISRSLLFLSQRCTRRKKSSASSPQFPFIFLIFTNKYVHHSKNGTWINSRPQLNTPECHRGLSKVANTLEHREARYACSHFFTISSNSNNRAQTAVHYNVRQSTNISQFRITEDPYNAL
jgi:hypothetical protein